MYTLSHPLIQKLGLVTELLTKGLICREVLTVEVTLARSLLGRVCRLSASQMTIWQQNNELWLWVTA